MIVDQEFYRPRPAAAVVVLGDTGEALLVRAVLESLGTAVFLHLIGTPQDFLRVIGQGDAAPRYTVICGHGDQTGLVFGEFGEGIDVTALERGSMPPAALTGRVDLPGKIVLSTACRTGSSAFAEAFLGGGVAAYRSGPSSSFPRCRRADSQSRALRWELQSTLQTPVPMFRCAPATRRGVVKADCRTRA